MASTLSISAAQRQILSGLSASATNISRTQNGLPCCLPRARRAARRLPSFGRQHLSGGGMYPPSARTSRGVIRAEATDKPSGGGTKFLTGFLIGGVVLGVLGYFFAPQISKTLLGENEDGSPRRLPRWLDEEDSLEATRRSLNEKIAQLNAAIDDVSAQLRADETADEELETSL